MKKNTFNPDNSYTDNKERTESKGLVPENLSTGMRDESQNKWLTAFEQPGLVQLTFSACIKFADLHGDGENRLVIADLGRINKPTDLNVSNSNNTSLFVGCRLLILRGTNIQSELALPQPPAGVIEFRSSTTDVGSLLGVAAGHCIYVYRNLRPFYKFALPNPSNLTEETEAWTSWSTSTNNSENDQKLIDCLESLWSKHGEWSLSSQSLNLLRDVNNSSSILKKIREYKTSENEPLSPKRNSVITCISTIRRGAGDQSALSCLLAGTEQRQLLIIEPHAFTVLHVFSLPSAPVFLLASGSYEVNYRLWIACRDAQIYALRRGWTAVRIAVQLPAQPVCMVKLGASQIVIACLDQRIYAYNGKGVCTWQVMFAYPICSMVSIHVKMLAVRLVAIALNNGEILFHNESQLVDRLILPQAVYSMQFGRFGREENTLAVITLSGELRVFILKRTAKFFHLDPVKSGETIINEANLNALNIPKKTKLFVEQTMHERDNSISIHRTYQQDLYHFRLQTATAYTGAMSSQSNALMSHNNSPIKISAQIHGLGPIFRLVIEVTNTYADKAAHHLFITLQCDPRIYKLQRTFISVPYLIPGTTHLFATKVEMISELNLTDTIKVSICNEKDQVPVMNAIINMPTSEPIE